MFSLFTDQQSNPSKYFSKFIALNHRSPSVNARSDSAVALLVATQNLRKWHAQQFPLLIFNNPNVIVSLMKA